MLLTRFLTEAGHGRLAVAELDEAENALVEVFTTGNETDVWSFSEAAIDALTLVVNEHDRQLLETRLEVVAAASARSGKTVWRYPPTFFGETGSGASEFAGRVHRPNLRQPFYWNGGRPAI
ncbi:hypothetical protein [Paraburkholderia lacunae]|uniref:Uncharacterized protein n=1 Tax=Paraburkholderia lacunae TaxID=2211104 RepID=A0A370N311_9BURK|nr:hypothetical protein [Paraburkholderia lacunae]RDK00030.1 hypothetical protein DLM46_25320 [Paraburkholderia lacunae]